MTNPRQAPERTDRTGLFASPARLAAALALGLGLAGFAAPSTAAELDCDATGKVKCAETTEEAPGDAPQARESTKSAKPAAVSTKATPEAQRAPKKNQIVWFFENRTGRQVQYKLYSMRRWWTWPGGDRAFVLPANGTTYKTKIQCQRGERVCYGAWQTNNRRIFWGVGFDARYDCRNCCFTCNGVSTPTFVFKR